MPLILVVGGEEFLASRAITSAIKDFEVAQREAGQETTTVTADSSNHISLDAGDFDLGEITDALAPSLFGGVRILIVKNIQDLSSDIQEELLSSIESIDEESLVLLWHKGGVKGKATLEKIKKVAARTIPVEPLKKESEKIDFLSHEFRTLGRKIEAEALVALVDALGGEIAELVSSASQLASDIPRGEVITVEEINRYHQGRIETTGFDVADAVMSRAHSEAIRALRNALNTGVDPIAITTALSSSIRTLAKVAASPRGVKAFELAGQLQLAPWQIDKARRQLNNWNPQSLARATVLLAQTDAEIKGASADPIYSLERTIIALTQ